METSSEFRYRFIFVLSAIGAVLLFYLAICAFINIEALKLKKKHSASSGFALLVAAIFYGVVAGYYYNEIKISSNNHKYIL